MGASLALNAGVGVMALGALIASLATGALRASLALRCMCAVDRLYKGVGPAARTVGYGSPGASPALRAPPCRPRLSSSPLRCAAVRRLVAVAAALLPRPLLTLPFSPVTPLLIGNT